MKHIRFDNFSFYYKNKNEYFEALKKINLTIERGELLCVVGESGGGKTTFLNSILGMGQYYEGEMYIDGESFENVDVKNLNIGVVRQEFVLYPHLTVYENIAFPLKAIKAEPKEIDKRVKEIAKTLEIEWLLTRKPRQLSIGQNQRVAIARALIKKPQLILFDEPFSNLDIELRRELRMLVKRIHEQYDTTIVFVTHELQEAFFLADRIAVISGGIIEDVGTPEELKVNPKSDLIKRYLNE